MIDATITVTCADSTVFTSSYQLATTLTDVGRYPAAVLAGPYHQRWEHESAYYALRHTIMNGLALRSGDPVGVVSALGEGCVPEADARSWEAWRAYGTTGQERTVAAARAWVDYWRTP
ncbi:hypothetical protein ACIRQY_23235 [Streptomyces sp. NPDC101490]|uniref:hypothetical protein n=1 Tax=Streptomyces sp. NPDC101490 TaxID=3366143 RepID=UPI00380CCA6B